MIPENRLPTHPGEILLKEFLEPNNLTQVDLANHLGTTAQRVNEIVRGRRGISPDTAWLFSQTFGTTPEFWINLNTTYELARNRPEKVVGRLVPVNNV